MPRGPRMSPAALALARAGIPQRVLAERLGLSQQSITFYLSGQRRPCAGLLPAVRLVAGTEAADEIADLLGITDEVAS
jgi:transcriptional regulator with XRE-family HTH domain